MPHLKYYDKERQMFPDAFGNKLKNEETKYFYKRLKSHYKIQQDLRLGTRGARCNRWTIELWNNPSVGVMAHEIAHAIDWNNGHARGDKWHTKKHLSIMKRVIAYAMRHADLWKDRCALKHQKAMNQNQVRDEKRKTKETYKKSPEGMLENLRKRQKKAITKLKRAQTNMKKIERRIGIWERKLKQQKERHLEQKSDVALFFSFLNISETEIYNNYNKNQSERD